jgi:hypothetical protein
MARSLLAAIAVAAGLLTAAAPASAVTGGTISVSPDPPQSGKPVTFTVTPDSATGSLTYDWDYDGNGSYELTGETTGSQTFTMFGPPRNGASINVYVNDSGGDSRLVTLTYNIVAGEDTSPLVVGVTAAKQRYGKVLSSGFEFALAHSHAGNLKVTMSVVAGKKHLKFASISEAANGPGSRNLSREPAGKAAKALRKLKGKAKILIAYSFVDARGKTAKGAKTFKLRN